MCLLTGRQQARVVTTTAIQFVQAGHMIKLSVQVAICLVTSEAVVKLTLRRMVQEHRLVQHWTNHPLVSCGTQAALLTTDRVPMVRLPHYTDHILKEIPQRLHQLSRLLQFTVRPGAAGVEGQLVHDRILLLKPSMAEAWLLGLHDVITLTHPIVPVDLSLQGQLQKKGCGRHTQFPPEMKAACIPVPKVTQS